MLKTSPFRESDLISHALMTLRERARPTTSPGPMGEEEFFIIGMRWLEDFIMKSHPDLGRRGAVCPFALPSHRANGLYVSVLDTSAFDFPDFIQLLLRIPQVYQDIQAGSEVPPDKFSLIVFLQNLGSDSYLRFVDVAHKVAKPVYMAQGLMLGEFHPLSEVLGVHSETFRPMRSAVPAFVIRSIAVHDQLFIDGNATPPSLRTHELQCFLDHVENQLPADDRSRLRSQLQALS